MQPQGRLGDKSRLEVDSHGCPSCPHPVSGPAMTGSPNVLVNGRPALRVADSGVYLACCGPNTWTALAGSKTVLINRKPAHRLDDEDQHGGSLGRLAEGSNDVFIGGPKGSGTSEEGPKIPHEIHVVLLSTLTGRPLKDVDYKIYNSAYEVVGSGRTDQSGLVRKNVPSGQYRIVIARTGRRGDLWVRLLAQDCVSELCNMPYVIDGPTGRLVGKTDERGVVKHTGMPDGRYRIQIGAGHAVVVPCIGARAPSRVRILIPCPRSRP